VAATQQGRLHRVVIPIHDDNPTRRTPVITYLLIALNFLFFFSEPVVSQIGVGSQTAAAVCQQQEYFYKYAAIPKELVHDRPLQRVPDGRVGRDSATGRLGCVVTAPSYHKQPYLSVLYAMFLHGGWLHILGNMLFLWVFGNNVEDMFGRLKFLVFYLFCGYVATYGFAVGNADTTTTLVGASGAIAGVLGAYLVLFPRARVTSLVPFLFFIPVWLPAWVVLGSWFVLQWLYFQGAATAEGAGVAYLAHVVGFAAGVVLIILFGGLRARRPPPPPAWYYQQR
jgi:membrane associated rhomboid family serine protease